MTSSWVTESKKATHGCQQHYKYAIGLTFSVDFVKARPPPTALGIASRCIEKVFALIVRDRRHESSCANMANFSPFLNYLEPRLSPTFKLTMPGTSRKD